MKLGKTGKLDSMTLEAGFFKKNVLFFALALFFGIASYSNSWNVPFQFDDLHHTLAKPSLHDIHHVSRIWSENIKTRFLVYMTFAFNYWLGKGDVRGYHFFNFGVHFLNTMWVYFLILLLLRTPKMHGQFSEKTGFYLAGLSALIFLTHPLQTQAVTFMNP